MEKDEKLWRIAQKRASFKKHLYTYLIINAFLWLTWFYGNNDGDNAWPIYTTIGWGIGLGFHYFSAYYGSKEDLAEREYNKLTENSKNEE
jgi:hypothetical protein